ncbi:MAG: hypothetical protein HXX19_13105 [Rhodoferax sp.]|nr:hypothetical protein [Rhodoferax sp.]
MSSPADTPTAQLRLDQSRARLRLALQRLHASDAAPPQGGPAAGSDWLSALRAEPGTRVLLEALAVWWARQPWQASASLVSSLVAQRLRPLAQRNPLGLVLSALAVGALVVVLRPWRWISVPALAAGLLPTLFSKLAAHLRPLSWADLLASWLQAGNGAAAPPEGPRQTPG